MVWVQLWDGFMLGVRLGDGLDIAVMDLLAWCDAVVVFFVCLLFFLACSCVRVSVRRRSVRTV